MKRLFPRFRPTRFHRGPNLRGRKIEREIRRAQDLNRRMKALNDLMVNL